MSQIVIGQDDIKICIVDNSETNDLRELTIPTVFICRPPENLGFGKGMNFGISKIRLLFPEITNLILSNYDIYLRDNWPIVLKRCLQKTITNSIISPKILSNGKTWFDISKISHFKITPKISGFGEACDVKTSDFGFEKSEFLSGCFLIMSVSTWDKLEGFDEKIFMYDEDVDLSLRARRLGIELLVSSSFFIEHSGQGSFATDYETPNQLDPRNGSFHFYVSNTIPNRFYLVKKNFNNRCYMLWFHGLYWLCKALQLFLQGHYDESRLILSKVKEARKW